MMRQIQIENMAHETGTLPSMVASHHASLCFPRLPIDHLRASMMQETVVRAPQ